MIKLIGAALLALFFSVTCLEPVGPLTVRPSDLAEGLTITVPPTLTEYEQDIPFEAEGIKVMLNDNGWVRDVTDDVKFSWNGTELKTDGKDTEATSETGAKEITVSYDYAGRIFETSFRIDVLGNLFIVTNGGEWAAALDAINMQTRDYYFITVRGDFEIPSAASAGIPDRDDGMSITLRTLPGENAVLTIDGPGSALYIKGNQIFIMDGEGLTFAGTDTNDSPLIRVEGSGARLELRNGAIMGNTSSGEGGGVSVTGSGSRFIMSGGEISGNTAWNGGGVYVYGGSFAMTGGSVSGNTATATASTGGHVGGGGVYLTANSTFTMSGRSSVSGNYAKQNGGGIFVQGDSTVTMLDESSVTSNKANGDGGGGLWLGNYTEGILNMKGGIISGNSCWYGGGIYAWGGGRFRMENGVIYGYNAPADLVNEGSLGGAALRLFSGGTGYRGTFTRDALGNEVFTSTAALNASENNTIKVRNGDLVPYP